MTPAVPLPCKRMPSWATDGTLKSAPTRPTKRMRGMTCSDRVPIGGVSGSTRGRRSRAGPEAPPRSRHGSSFVSPFLVRLARRTGAGLAPPHPGHEQQPRSRRRGGRARGATWSDSTPRPRPPPAGATGRWRGRPRGLWPRRGGPGHVRARRRSAGSPAGLGSPGEPGPEVRVVCGRGRDPTLRTLTRITLPSGKPAKP